MNMNNRARVDEGLMLVRDAIRPGLEQAWRTRFGNRWLEKVDGLTHGDHIANPNDIAFLLKGIEATWNQFFRKRFDRKTRTYLNFIRDARNEWAHGKDFDNEETFVILSHCQNVLQDFGADESTIQKLKSQKDNLMTQRSETSQTSHDPLILPNETMVKELQTAQPSNQGEPPNALLATGKPIRRAGNWYYLLDPKSCPDQIGRGDVLEVIIKPKIGKTRTGPHRIVYTNQGIGYILATEFIDPAHDNRCNHRYRCHDNLGPKGSHKCSPVHPQQCVKCGRNWGGV